MFPSHRSIRTVHSVYAVRVHASIAHSQTLHICSPRILPTTLWQNHRSPSSGDDASATSPSSRGTSEKVWGLKLTKDRRRSPVGAPGRGVGRPILRCATAATYLDARTNWRAPTLISQNSPKQLGMVSQELVPGTRRVRPSS